MRKIRFALGAVALAAVFHFIPFFDPAEALLVRGFSDIGYGIRNGALGIGAVAEQIFAAGRIQKENAALSAQVIALNEKMAAAASLAAENDSLKGLLDFRSRSGLKLIACEIVGADPDTSARALTIDCGTESKVTRGQAVITGDGTLVGRIERVANGRSTVLLPTDPRSALAVMVSEHPESNGVARGERGLIIAMSLIPQHAPISSGDTIVTTGREEGMPRGLVLGMVESVVSVASDPFISATVAPAIDPIDLTKVAVIVGE